MTGALVAYRADHPPLTISINGRNPTFILNTDKIAAQLVVPIAPVLMDLLEIASTVFAADSSVSRGGSSRSEMGSSWRRRFDFDIQVRDPEFWSRDEVSEALKDCVEFLTEDNVSFRFRERDEDATQQAFLEFDPAAPQFMADRVILFSGGLDSFAGALEYLSTTDKRVVLVTHRSAQKAITRQVELGKYLSREFPGRVLHVQIRATRIGSVGRETTQRSRSLLFAALGQVVSRTLGADAVHFYENGIISHNLPISPQVIGTMATRTTHPLSLTKLNTLMGLIGPDPCRINNEFQWLTKSDIVAKIAKHGGADRISQAVSCTSIREQTTLHTHCGKCSQCLDRRFAILANGLAEQDPDIHYICDVITGARETATSRTMAAEWTRHSLLLGSLDLRGFLERFGQDIARIALGHPELDAMDAARRTLEMHGRHSEAVRRGLAQAIRDQAEALVARSIPETALLRLHLAATDPTDAVLPVDPRLAATTPPLDLVGVEERDTLLDPHRPLEVKFFEEQGRPVVSVRGLCRITRRPASIAHVLKRYYDDDRRNTRSREDCTFVAAGVIGADFAITKNAVSQAVDRCRKTLEEAYLNVIGHRPDRELLIETKKPLGYRLDPDIREVG